MRIGNINRFSIGKPLIIFVNDFFGAFFITSATRDTLVHIDIARVLFYGNGEISCFTFDGSHFGKGEKLDVQVPADLDQFG